MLLPVVETAILNILDSGIPFDRSYLKGLVKDVELNPLTIWTAIERHHVFEFKMIVEYIDPSCSAVKKTEIKTDTLPKFRQALKDYVHEYDTISECTVMVKYRHSMGDQIVYDFIITPRTSCSFEVLNSVKENILTWIDAHPELLV